MSRTVLVKARTTVDKIHLVIDYWEAEKLADALLLYENEGYDLKIFHEGQLKGNLAEMLVKLEEILDERN